MKKTLIVIIVIILSCCKKPPKGTYALTLTDSSGLTSVPYRGEEYMVNSEHIYYRGYLDGVLAKDKKNVSGILKLENFNGSTFTISINGKIVKSNGFYNYKISGTYEEDAYSSGTFEIIKTN